MCAFIPKDEFTFTTVICSLIFFLFVWQQRRTLSLAFAERETALFSIGTFTTTVFAIFVCVLWLTSLMPIPMLLSQISFLGWQLKDVATKLKRKR